MAIPVRDLLILPCGGNGSKGYPRGHTYVAIAKKADTGLVCCFPPEYLNYAVKLGAEVRESLVDCPHCQYNYPSPKKGVKTPDELSRERKNESNHVRALEQAVAEGLRKLGVVKAPV